MMTIQRAKILFFIFPSMTFLCKCLSNTPPNGYANWIKRVDEKQQKDKSDFLIAQKSVIEHFQDCLKNQINSSDKRILRCTTPSITFDSRKFRNATNETLTSVGATQAIQFPNVVIHPQRNLDVEISIDPQTQVVRMCTLKYDDELAK